VTITGWKAQVKAWKTWSGWKKGSRLTPVSLNRMKDLSAFDLAVIAQNEMHDDTVRQAARDELSAREGEAPNAAAICVPSFISPGDVGGMYRRTFGWTRTLRILSGWVILAFVILTFAAIGWHTEHVDDVLSDARQRGLISGYDYLDKGRRATADEIAEIPRDARSSAFDSDIRYSEVLLWRVRDTDAAKNLQMVGHVGTFGIIGMCVSFLAWFLLTLFRRKPVRILLLRKFNRKKLSKSMSHVIDMQLRPFGHVMTLSDRYFQKSKWDWFMFGLPANPLHIALYVIWLPLRIILRQFNRAKWGPAWVGSARNFRSLAQRLRDRIGLNFEIMWGKQGSFLIRTSDQWWQNVITLLMRSADVIIVDVSDVTQGTKWELNRLDGDKAWENAIFMSLDEKEGQARAALSEYAWRQPKIWLYEKSGRMEGEKEFRQAVIDAVERNLKDRYAG